MADKTDNANELLPCPEWKIDLIAGFPWESDDPDADLQRSYAADEAGLLYLEKTKKGSSDEYNYGHSVFRLTPLGKQALNTRQPTQPAPDRAAIEQEDWIVTELGLLYNYKKDNSQQFTRWQMMTAISHGYRLGLEVHERKPVQSQSIPSDGFISVPEQCTDEMGEAFRELFHECQRTFTSPSPRQVWDAMINAYRKGQTK